jgi:hypothetical protein
MSKLVLQDVTSGFSAQERINANSAALEEALEKTLSRDGTAPNAMEAALDMDSNRVINLGAPAAGSDAARWVDVTDAVELTGAAVPALTGNTGKSLTTDGTSLAWDNLPPYIERTAEESSASVTPTDFSYEPWKGIDARRFGLSVDGDTADEETNSAAIANAILAAREYGVENVNPNRDQGVDIYLPAGLIYLSEPIVMPRSGNPRANCIGFIGDGVSTRLAPGPSFPANRGLIEWEPETSRVFRQRLKNFKIDMRDGLAHKAIWFKLNDPTTTVFGGQQWAQEEVKELDIDVMIHGNNTDHEVLVDIEGKIKYSNINITADLAAGTAQTYSTIVLRANSPYIDTSGNPGDKNDAIVDNAGVNYSEVAVFAVNSRGGRATAFQGRFHDCFITRLGSATGAYGSASVVELYGSTANTVAWIFCEGRQEDPQVYLEECHNNQFLTCLVGTPDAPGPATAFGLVGCEGNVFWNHPSGSSKPSYASQGGFLVDLDANSKHNRFYNFDSNGAFSTEVNDLGTDNYFEYTRASTGDFTQTHKQSSFTVGPFTQDNVTASQANVAMSGSRWIAPRAGYVTGAVIKSNAARTAGTLTIKIYKNTDLAGTTGSEILSSLRPTLDGTNTSSNADTTHPPLAAFAAGDEIYATITTDGSWAPTTADVAVYIEVQC